MMKLFPYKWVKVADRLHVFLSNHYCYSDFGVRESGEMHYSGRCYVVDGTPGTGFVERESGSHSYNQFVRKKQDRLRPSYWKLLTGKEPSFDRALAEANKALANATNQRKRDFLECYVNALTVAGKEEYVQRVIGAIKDKMGHRNDRFMVSVISHYKNKARQLEHEMDAVQWHVNEHCSQETYEAYCEMVKAFTRVAACRRIWHHNPRKKHQYNQVFFDLGVFDYIRSDTYLPLMRDSQGRQMYLLPDAMIVAHSAVDFDVLPLKTLTIVCQELAIVEPTEDMLSSIGDAASMIEIPKLGLNFYFNHYHAIRDFVQAVDKLKSTL